MGFVRAESGVSAVVVEVASSKNMVKRKVKVFMATVSAGRNGGPGG